MLYHYCSTTAFFSIFQNRSIYLSSLSSSNDTMEGRWLSSALRRLMARKRVHPNITSDLMRRITFLEQLHLCYGFCLSEMRDMLSQWRGYADDAAGFAIGFNREALEKAIGDPIEPVPFGYRLIDVIYDEAVQEALLEPKLDELLALIGDGKFFRPTMSGVKWSVVDSVSEADKPHKELSDRLDKEVVDWSRLIFATKNPAFSEEKELRIIKHGILMHMGTKFRVRGNALVPYLEFSFADTLWPALVEEVLLGPRNPTHISVVRDFLRNCGSSARAELSSASYR